MMNEKNPNPAMTQHITWGVEGFWSILCVESLRDRGVFFHSGTGEIT